MSVDMEGTSSTSEPSDVLAFTNSKGRPVDVPETPGPIADTHAHLDLIADAPRALARCAALGVDFVISIVDPSENHEAYIHLEEWRVAAAALLASWGELPVCGGRKACECGVPHVRLVVGVHPHNAKLFTASVERELIELASDERTSGIGEIGLDYHYDLSPRDLQKDVFARQLRMAHVMGLPVSLHIREAHDDALEILRREGVPEAGCILHCFNLGDDVLEEFLGLGCHVALGGPITFKKSGETRSAVPHIPLERLLTETDCPFMAPEPCRGTDCEPAHVVFSAARLHDVYSQAVPDCPSAGEFYQRVFDNALLLLDRAPVVWQGDSGARGALLESAHGAISDEGSARLVAIMTEEE